jgi:hypothetical protein
MIRVRRFSRECWTDSTNNIGLNGSYLFTNLWWSWWWIIDIKHQLMMGHGVSKVVKTPTNGCVDFCLHFLISRFVEVGCSSSTRGHRLQSLGTNPAWICTAIFDSPWSKTWWNVLDLFILFILLQAPFLWEQNPTLSMVPVICGVIPYKQQRWLWGYERAEGLVRRFVASSPTGMHVQVYQVSAPKIKRRASKFSLFRNQNLISIFRSKDVPKSGRTKPSVVRFHLKGFNCDKASYCSYVQRNG